jgi:hypothetical protein
MGDTIFQQIGERNVVNYWILALQWIGLSKKLFGFHQFFFFFPFVELFYFLFFSKFDIFKLNLITAEPEKVLWYFQCSTK